MFALVTIVLYLYSRVKSHYISRTSGLCRLFLIQKNAQIISEERNLLQEGLIFIVDYKILEGVPTMDKPDDKRYINPAMGLFYLRKNDDMVPIAIQLGQQPGEDNPIWTPLKDTEWDWIMAKLWLRCADTQYHQVNMTINLKYQQ